LSRAVGAFVEGGGGGVAIRRRTHVWSYDR